MTFPTYFETFDARQMLADYPIGDAFTTRYTGMSRAILLSEALGSDAVMVMPTAPQPGFAHGQRAPATQADFTAIASVAGLPALSIPAGFDANRLPVGVQLIGPAGSETRLITLARRIEAGIHAYAPPLP